MPLESQCWGGGDSQIPEVCILAHRVKFQVQSVVERDSRWQELKAAGHIVPMSRKQSLLLFSSHSPLP